MHQSKSNAFEFGRLTRFGVFKLSGVVALAMLGLVGSQPAEAAITIQTPAGLSPGDTFRIAFVTDAITQAISPDISTYNTVVNTDATNEAGGGTVTYAGVTLHFSAIASTASISAINNIGEDTIHNTPIYLSDGTMITQSDNSAGLWSGSLIHAIDEDLAGQGQSLFVWSGTNNAGQGAVMGTLGTSRPTIGRSAESDFQWNNFTRANPTMGLTLYAVSQPLAVASVPEPSSIVVWMIVAVCGAVGAYARRGCRNIRGR